MKHDMLSFNFAMDDMDETFLSCFRQYLVVFVLENIDIGE